jgi:hypothetical protein
MDNKKKAIFHVNLQENIYDIDIKNITLGMNTNENDFNSVVDHFFNNRFIATDVPLIDEDIKEFINEGYKQNLFIQKNQVYFPLKKGIIAKRKAINKLTDSLKDNQDKFIELKKKIINYTPSSNIQFKDKKRLHVLIIRRLFEYYNESKTPTTRESLLKFMLIVESLEESTFVLSPKNIETINQIYYDLDQLTETEKHQYQKTLDELLEKYKEMVQPNFDRVVTYIDTVVKSGSGKKEILLQQKQELQEKYNIIPALIVKEQDINTNYQSFLTFIKTKMGPEDQSKVFIIDQEIEAEFIKYFKKIKNDMLSAYENLSSSLRVYMRINSGPGGMSIPPYQGILTGHEKSKAIYNDRRTCQTIYDSSVTPAIQRIKAEGGSVTLNNVVVRKDQGFEDVFLRNISNETDSVKEYSLITECYPQTNFKLAFDVKNGKIKEHINFEKILKNFYNGNTYTFNTTELRVISDENKKYKVKSYDTSNKQIVLKSLDNDKEIQNYNETLTLGSSLEAKTLNLVDLKSKELEGMSRPHYGPFQEVFETMNRHLDKNFDSNEEIFYGNCCYLSKYEKTKNFQPINREEGETLFDKLGLKFKHFFNRAIYEQDPSETFNLIGTNELCFEVIKDVSTLKLSFTDMKFQDDPTKEPLIIERGSEFIKFTPVDKAAKTIPAIDGETTIFDHVYKIYEYDLTDLKKDDKIFLRSLGYHFYDKDVEDEKKRIVAGQFTINGSDNFAFLIDVNKTVDHEGNSTKLSENFAYNQVNQGLNDLNEMLKENATGFTIFGYGYSGTGKSFTLFGSPNTTLFERIKDLFKLYEDTCNKLGIDSPQGFTQELASNILKARLVSEEGIPIFVFDRSEPTNPYYGLPKFFEKEHDEVTKILQLLFSDDYAVINDTLPGCYQGTYNLDQILEATDRDLVTGNLHRAGDLEIKKNGENNVVKLDKSLIFYCDEIEDKTIGVDNPSISVDLKKIMLVANYLHLVLLNDIWSRSQLYTPAEKNKIYENIVHGRDVFADFIHRVKSVELNESIKVKKQEYLKKIFIQKCEENKQALTAQNKNLDIEINSLIEKLNVEHNFQSIVRIGKIQNANPTNPNSRNVRFEDKMNEFYSSNISIAPAKYIIYRYLISKQANYFTELPSLQPLFHELTGNSKLQILFEEIKKFYDFDGEDPEEKGQTVFDRVVRNQFNDPTEVDNLEILSNWSSNLRRILQRIKFNREKIKENNYTESVFSALPEDSMIKQFFKSIKAIKDKITKYEENITKISQEEAYKSLDVRIGEYKPPDMSSQLFNITPAKGKTPVYGFVQHCIKDLVDSGFNVKFYSILDMYGKLKGDSQDLLLENGKIVSYDFKDSDSSNTIIDSFEKQSIRADLTPQMLQVMKDGISNKTDIVYLYDILEKLEKQRIALGYIKPTPNNIKSSRAHLLITFEVTKKDHKDPKTSEKWKEPTQKSYITIIDMAGIENPYEIADKVNTFKQSINTSTQERKKILVDWNAQGKTKLNDLLSTVVDIETYPVEAGDKYSKSIKDRNSHRNKIEENINNLRNAYEEEYTTQKQFVKVLHSKFNDNPRVTYVLLEIYLKQINRLFCLEKTKEILNAEIKVNDDVEFFNDDSEEWVQGKVKNIMPDGKYTITYNGREVIKDKSEILNVIPEVVKTLIHVKPVSLKLDITKISVDYYLTYVGDQKYYYENTTDGKTQKFVTIKTSHTDLRIPDKSTAENFSLEGLNIPSTTLFQTVDTAFSTENDLKPLKTNIKTLIGELRKQPNIQAELSFPKYSSQQETFNKYFFRTFFENFSDGNKTDIDFLYLRMLGYPLLQWSEDKKVSRGTYKQGIGTNDTYPLLVQKLMEPEVHEKYIEFQHGIIEDNMDYNDNKDIARIQKILYFYKKYGNLFNINQDNTSFKLSLLDELNNVLFNSQKEALISMITDIIQEGYFINETITHIVQYFSHTSKGKLPSDPFDQGDKKYLQSYYTYYAGSSNAFEKKVFTYFDSDKSAKINKTITLSDLSKEYIPELKYTQEDLTLVTSERSKAHAGVTGEMKKRLADKLLEMYIMNRVPLVRQTGGQTTESIDVVDPVGITHKVKITSGVLEYKVFAKTEYTVKSDGNEEAENITVKLMYRDGSHSEHTIKKGTQISITFKNENSELVTLYELLTEIPETLPEKKTKTATRKEKWLSVYDGPNKHTVYDFFTKHYDSLTDKTIGTKINGFIKSLTGDIKEEQSLSFPPNFWSFAPEEVKSYCLNNPTDTKGCKERALASALKKDTATVKMIPLLQYLNHINTNTKYVMLCLVKPEIKAQYCEGARKGMLFGQDVASTSSRNQKNGYDEVIKGGKKHSRRNKFYSIKTRKNNK